MVANRWIYVRLPAGLVLLVAASLLRRHLPSVTKTSFNQGRAA
jgi:hypothetical protein